MASKNQIETANAKCESFIINCDYQGFKFNKCFLIGDAGGFSSELTGEGIYQAFVTGKEVGKMLLNPHYKSNKIDEILRVKRKHNLLQNVLIKSGRFRKIFFYLGFGLLKIPHFSTLTHKIIKSDYSTGL